MMVNNYVIRKLEDLMRDSWFMGESIQDYGIGSHRGIQPQEIIDFLCTSSQMLSRLIKTIEESSEEGIVDSLDDLNNPDWSGEAEVFPLMCPITGHNCHSLCTCYRDGRTSSLAIATPEDMLHRVDGYTFGRCTRFDFTICTDRD